MKEIDKDRVQSRIHERDNIDSSTLAIGGWRQLELPLDY